MNSIIRISVFTAFMAIGAGTVSAAPCFTDNYIPEQMSCGSGAVDGFADFTKGGCTYTPPRIDRVEIECVAGWYNVPETTHRGPKNYTHAELCATHGKRPSNTNGKICASGESRANSGNRLEEINYKYGIDWSHRVNGGDSWIDNHISGESVCGWANEREGHDVVIAVYCE